MFDSITDYNLIPLYVLNLNCLLVACFAIYIHSLYYSDHDSIFFKKLVLMEVICLLRHGRLFLSAVSASWPQKYGDGSFNRHYHVSIWKNIDWIKFMTQFKHKYVEYQQSIIKWTYQFQTYVLMGRNTYRNSRFIK